MFIHSCLHLVQVAVPHHSRLVQTALNTVCATHVTEPVHLVNVCDANRVRTLHLGTSHCAHVTPINLI